MTADDLTGVGISEYRLAESLGFYGLLAVGMGGLIMLARRRKRTV